MADRLELMSLGKELEQQNRFEEAERHFSELVRLFRQDPAAWDLLGSIHWRQEKYHDANKAWIRATALRHGRKAAIQRNYSELPDWIEVSITKLQHTCEQLCYLRDLDLVDGLSEQIDAYKWILSNISSGRVYVPRCLIPKTALKPVLQTFDRLVHLYQPAAVKGSALNPDIDFKSVEAQFRETGVGVMDNFLSPQAFFEMRRHFLESTMWFDTGASYIGTQVNTGLGSPLCLQIGAEIKNRFPKVIADLALRQLWSFRYDNNMKGINPHADPASVNLNIWLTPDSANLNPSAGGLIVYDAQPPADWSYREFNGKTNRVEQYLAEIKPKKVIVPYRENRALLFNPRHFHETDRFHFAPGFVNWRTSITYLFGPPGMANIGVSY